MNTETLSLVSHLREGPGQEAPDRQRARPKRAGSLALGIAGGLLMLALLGGVGFGAAYLVGLVWSLPTQVAEAAAAAAILLLSARALASGRPRARKFAAVERLRARRADLYTGLIEALDESWSGEPGRHAFDTLGALERQLVLTGSPRVVRRYDELREHGSTPGPEADARLGRLLVAMRRDLLDPGSGGPAEALARLTRSAG